MASRSARERERDEDRSRFDALEAENKKLRSELKRALERVSAAERELMEMKRRFAPDIPTQARDVMAAWKKVGEDGKVKTLAKPPIYDVSAGWFTVKSTGDPIKGMGVFAKYDMPPNGWLPYLGKMTTQRMYDELKDEQKRYIMGTNRVGRYFNGDPSLPEAKPTWVASRVNEPTLTKPNGVRQPPANCQLKVWRGRPFIITKNEIRAGEELLVHYGDGGDFTRKGYTVARAVAKPKWMSTRTQPLFKRDDFKDVTEEDWKELEDNEVVQVWVAASASSDDEKAELEEHEEGDNSDAIVEIRRPPKAKKTKKKAAAAAPAAASRR